LKDGFDDELVVAGFLTGRRPWMQRVGHNYADAMRLHSLKNI